MSPWPKPRRSSSVVDRPFTGGGVVRGAPTITAGRDITTPPVGRLRGGSGAGVGARGTGRGPLAGGTVEDGADEAPGDGGAVEGVAAGRVGNTGALGREAGPAALPVGSTVLSRRRTEYAPG